MTEASGGASRAEMERRLIDRSLQDEEFRQKLLAEPTAAIEQELGSRLPESVEVRVVEERAETPSTWCFPAPRRSAKAARSPTRG